MERSSITWLRRLPSQKRWRKSYEKCGCRRKIAPHSGDLPGPKILRLPSPPQRPGVSEFGAGRALAGCTDIKIAKQNNMPAMKKQQQVPIQRPVTQAQSLL